MATQLKPERLDYLVEMHASLARQSIRWQAVIALDGANPRHLPAPLAADPRVRVLELPRPVGAGAARNLALNLVDTDLVTYVDDDDVLPDDSLAVRYQRITETGLGWIAGWSADLQMDGSATTWHCPTPPGLHGPGDVTRYWTSPHSPIPLGQTMLLARTDLVRAAGGHGGLPQGEDFLMVNTVTSLSAGELLPHVVYFYRKHPAQMTAGGPVFDQYEEQCRTFAWQQGRRLSTALLALHQEHAKAPA
ncbi:glycosyltransferase [Streptomyces sp. NPDC051561]|uniref:glycosyltransferase n=1 Tax=Streptomyces sp. NPDC051561 TaxID=3365658 RepID=UPI00378FEA34